MTVNKGDPPPGRLGVSAVDPGSERLGYRSGKEKGDLAKMARRGGGGSTVLWSMEQQGGSPEKGLIVRVDRSQE
jgi:hypothetical protein